MKTELIEMTQREWLEADGLGGFACGTVSGIRTRGYHALLLAATRPPTGRIVLVNDLDAQVETTAGTYALSSQAYAPNVVHPGRRPPHRRIHARALAEVALSAQPTRAITAIIITRRAQRFAPMAHLKAGI
jgi:hypothetical protein